ncbi:MAG TPA: tetrathionate reductase subunit TtrA, partial [Rhodobacterales bacterium]|nr:tetrathionate reductase subunit TtrA [Rhodobacterales bacterium]
LADGTPLREAFPESDWPMTMVAFKSNLQSAYSIASPVLRSIQPDNPVSINPEDAAKAGIKSGDKLRIVTPGGSQIATALVREGVSPGVVAIPHGYGHWELGARAHEIDGVSQPEIPGLAAGVSLNAIGLQDPHRGGSATLGDWAIGSAARQALPARIERV